MLTEMMGASLKVCLLDPASPLPFIEAHKIRAIAVTGAVRLPRSPGVLTMGEQGHPFETVGWFGVFAPAGTPRHVVQRLSDEINRIQGQPDMIARVTSLNIGPPPAGSPEQFRQLVVDDFSTWKRIVAETGITMEN